MCVEKNRGDNVLRSNMGAEMRRKSLSEYSGTVVDAWTGNLVCYTGRPISGELDTIKSFTGAKEASDKFPQSSSKSLNRQLAMATLADEKTTTEAGNNR